ncbi:hypothetical protein ANACOL_03694 [Anaerotruncus colihominis DSM 17241]|uniref:Uncharacterized protein n=1 Tax=Anaerotruncus colihominis DSM 17241 TaxID=445972 RepID=B0PFW1_9FIRM|nr:hypothetical protein ANACOL_03694 [Anaerotruncus colihominis DSM 17241]
MFCTSSIFSILFLKSTVVFYQICRMNARAFLQNFHFDSTAR